MFKKRQVNLSNAVVDGWVTRRYVVQSRLAKRQTGPGRRRCPLVSGRRADAGEPFWRLARGVSKPAWREMLTGCWRSRSCHEPVCRTREYFPHHIDSPCSSGRGGRGRGGTRSGQTGSLDLGRPASATVPLWSRRHRGIVSLTHISVVHSTQDTPAPPRSHGIVLPVPRLCYVQDASPTRPHIARLTRAHHHQETARRHGPLMNNAASQPRRRHREHPASRPPNILALVRIPFPDVLTMAFCLPHRASTMPPPHGASIVPSRS